MTDSLDPAGAPATGEWLQTTALSPLRRRELVAVVTALAGPTTLAWLYLIRMTSIMAGAAAGSDPDGVVLLIRGAA